MNHNLTKISILLFTIFTCVCNAQDVTIGEKVWMLKNLDVTSYKNGDIIPQVSDPTEWANLKTGAWCYYENDTVNGHAYGRLYNGYAINDPRGICPIGYHIPSDKEVYEITGRLPGYGGKNIDNHIKLKALRGGYRAPNGNFNDVGGKGMWWHINDNKNMAAWTLESNDENNIIATATSKLLNFGCSVRCVKD